MKKNIAVIAITAIGIILIVVITVVSFNQGIKKVKVKQAERPVKIGVINFLTGAQAALGEEVNNALFLANEIDNQKNKKEIILAVEDSQDDPKVGISAYNKLKLQGITAFIASGDQVNYALSPIANNDKNILQMIVAGSQAMAGDYTFRGWVTGEQQAKTIGNYAVNDLGIDKIGIIYINNIYGESFRNEFVKTVNENNGVITSEEIFGIADKDTKTQILKIMKKKPSAIAVSGFGPAYILVFKQLRELGWDGILLTDAALSVPYFFNSIGIENLNNTYFFSTNFDLDNPENEQMKFYIEEYKKRYNADAGWVGAFAYDSYSALSSSIRKCGYDSVQIKKCLVGIKNMPGIQGNMDFSSHEMKIPFYVKKVENEKVIIKKIIK